MLMLTHIVYLSSPSQFFAINWSYYFQKEEKNEYGDSTASGMDDIRFSYGCFYSCKLMHRGISSQWLVIFWYKINGPQNRYTVNAFEECSYFNKWFMREYIFRLVISFCTLFAFGRLWFEHQYDFDHMWLFLLLQTRDALNCIKEE